MKVLFGIGHPAHVHFFRNAIRKLEEDGHEVRIIARDKEITLKLLDAYGFDYQLYGKYRNNFAGKIAEIPYNDYLFYKIAKEFKPDILAGILQYPVAHVGKIINKPSIIFTDTEHAANNLVCPFADVICTPACYKIDFGKKQIRYDGYKELAYLHPNYFKPDPSVLADLGLSKNDKFIIIKLNSWAAWHDTYSKGFSYEFLEKVIKSFEEYGFVFISSDNNLPMNFQKYRLNNPPENMHSILHFAQLYIGEGETMATESAILGTPSIDVEAIKMKNKIVDITAVHGHINEIVNKYNLMFAFSEQNLALNKAIELLEDNKLKEKWLDKREVLLKDKIDVTSFITGIIEGYPEKFNYYKNY